MMMMAMSVYTAHDSIRLCALKEILIFVVAVVQMGTK